MRLLLIILPMLFSLSFAEQKPNFIIILSDDAGYADFGFQSSKEFKTPHIDSIAVNGATFTNAYVPGCVCSPSRAGLLTGRYQARFGHENNLPPGHKLGLPTTETTFADNMKALGYKTAVIGKWHLGYQPQYHPNKRGFDYFYGLLQGSRSYKKYTKPSDNRVIQLNGIPTDEVDEYMTDRLGDNAATFITDNKAVPFFLYLSFTAVHGPYQSKEEDLKFFENADLSKPRKNLAAMTKSLDDNVGKVLNALKQCKLTENTIVVFLNDNGGTGPAVNTPLNGKKGTLYEGGIRVPFCMQWPAKIKKGQVLNQAIIGLDLLPTAISAAGSIVPAGQKLDGVSLLPLLTGTESKIKRALYWRKHTGSSTAWAALREGKWKLHKQTDKYMLFDLVADPAEQIDVKEKHLEIFSELQNKLKNWEKQMIPPKWGKGSEIKKAKKS
jgi:arylsulfatase A-like enzyme